MQNNPIELTMTSAGIPVLTEHVPNSASAGFLVAVRTGSRDEYDGIFGLSHLLEHTVFRETKTRNSFEMAKEMEGAGGELNAFTAKEMTGFYGITLGETADVAMKLVGDIVANPLINEKDTELEKEIVLQELSMVKSEPESYVHDLFEENLWAGNELGRDEGGSEETVIPLTHEDLRKYYDERYGRPNLAVFATGNFDKEEVVKWAEETFDPMDAPVVNKRTTPDMPKAKYSCTEHNSEHLNIGFGFPVGKLDAKERAAVRVLGAVMGAGTSSRLFQNVREKNALVYSIYNDSHNYSDAGYISAFMSCTGKNVIKAMEETARSYSDFKKNGLEKDELQRTKNLLKGAVARGAETTDNRVYRMCVGYMTHGSASSTADTLAQIDAVTEDEVMAVAEKYLTSDRLNITVLGRCSKKVQAFEFSSLEI
ncbi:MAG: insulinase family protein [archaeon]|nr:insulinase family protein [archaeon]